MNQNKRYTTIDGIRGVALICMVIYHMLWDMVYLFEVNLPWYHSTAAYVWQQCICWTFIFISGFCWSMGTKKLKRGLIVSGAGMLITLVTTLVMPQDKIIFGVLTLIGCCMLIMIPLEKLFIKIPPSIGFAVSTLFFILFRNINTGYLGFEQFRIMELPKSLYSNLFTTWLGFQKPDFHSSDYFSLIPWCFLFFAGYFCYKFIEKKQLLNILTKGKCRSLEWVGKNSLKIYIIHQPLLYVILYSASELSKCTMQ